MSKPPAGKKEKVRLASLAGLPFNHRVNVFAYGSLMFDEVWRTVVGRINPSLEASLADHEAWKIAGQTFPGLTPAPRHRLFGRVWQGVQPDELARLDEFESGIYDRKEVQVHVTSGEGLTSWAYVVRPDCRTLLTAERWDHEEFQRLHLDTFISSKSD